MAETYRIVLTDEALSDLHEIARYIRQYSPQNAVAVADAILAAIDSLSFMPARFRRAGRSRKRGSDVHAMLVRPFIVYYRVELSPAAVFVLTVRHGARRQPRRFD